MRTLYVEFAPMSPLRELNACMALGLGDIWCAAHPSELEVARTRLVAIRIHIPTDYEIPALSVLSAALEYDVTYVTDGMISTHTMVFIDVIILLIVMVFMWVSLLASAQHVGNRKDSPP